MSKFLIVFLAVLPITIWTIWAFIALGFELRARLSPQQIVSIFAAITGLFSLSFVILGVRNHEDFYANLATELGSIAITIFVIDRLYQWRSEEQEKRRIIEQMGSPSNDFAVEATRLAREKGWLRDGSLRDANFDLADLRKVNLDRGNLRRASFVNTRLENANFGDAVLEGTNFSNAHLESSVFIYAKLKEARLLGANSPMSTWMYADLEAADLRLVVFREANLRYANFQRANLVGTNFEGAHLGGANLANTNTLGAFLQNAKYTKDTLWPDNFDPNEHGAVLVEEDWPVMPSMVEILPYLKHLKNSI